MSEWTSGYVADINYTYGFYRELTPALLSFVALARGQRGPDAGTTFDYCELGCGQGLSMNLLAAANPHGRFFATDFNPSQIAGARALCADAGLSNLSFYDHSFADFADAPGLPESFDFISLHGIYSWISEENRATIVEFIRRKLKVGGLVYVSYNALPGWSAAAPMRHLMYLHGKARGGPTISRLDAALGFVDQMQQAGAAFFAGNPGLKARFDRLKGLHRNYLAHEYLNDAWTLLYHSEVASEMNAAKLTYLGSAALLEQVDVVNLTPEQQAIMAGIEDPVLRETVRDFMTNQQFRRDVFVKGPVPLSVHAAQEAWLQQRFALSTNRADIALKVTGARGEATLQSEVYTPILDALSAGPKTVRELVANPAVAALGAARLQEALRVLVGAAHLQPCLPAKDDSKRAKSTKAINQVLLERGRYSGDLQFLASPVTGGGLMIGRIQQLFVLARQQKASDLAAFAWQVLNSQNQRVIKEGKPLQSEEENLAELRGQVGNFMTKQLPILERLQAV